jgi:hypothetical protein
MLRKVYIQIIRVKYLFLSVCSELNERSAIGEGTNNDDDVEEAPP